MKPLRALLLPLLLAAGRAAVACPACAGSGPAKEANIWPVVGVFLVVPWLLAGAVMIVVKREAARTS